MGAPGMKRATTSGSPAWTRHLGPHGTREQHEHLPRFRPLVQQHFARVQCHAPELVGELGPLAERQEIVEQPGGRVRG